MSRARRAKVLLLLYKPARIVRPRCCNPNTKNAKISFIVITLARYPSEVWRSTGVAVYCITLSRETVNRLRTQLLLSIHVSARSTTELGLYTTRRASTLATL